MGALRAVRRLWCAVFHRHAILIEAYGVKIKYCAPCNETWVDDGR